MGISRELFTKEFKLAAVRRLEQGVSIAEASRALEVNPSVLYRWRREFRQGTGNAFPGNGKQRWSSYSAARPATARFSSGLKNIIKEIGRVIRLDRAPEAQTGAVIVSARVNDEFRRVEMVVIAAGYERLLLPAHRGRAYRLSNPRGLQALPTKIAQTRNASTTAVGFRSITRR